MLYATTCGFGVDFYIESWIGLLLSDARKCGLVGK